MEYASFHHLKAFIYHEQGELDSALAALDTAVLLADTSSVVACSFTECFRLIILAESGRNMEIDAVAERVIAAADESRTIPGDYRFAQGVIAYVRGDLDSAEACFMKANEEAEGRSHSTQYMLGRTLLQSGKYEQAIPIFEKMVSIHWECRLMFGPWVVTPYHYLGIAYEELGNREKAIESYETFLNLWRVADPDLRRVQEVKARLAALKRS